MDWFEEVGQSYTAWSVSHWVVILNPKSGKGTGARAEAAVRSWLDQRSILYTLSRTTGAGHAREIAAQGLKDGRGPLVAIGGDGTVSELGAALLELPTSALGIVALGNGNDLARNLGLPIGSIDRALQVIEAGHERRIDVGVDQGEPFLSVLGLGFPSAVASAANRVKWLRGRAAFSWGVYWSLLRMEPFPVELTIDGKSCRVDATSILIQNTALTGGGLKTAPGARLDDGMLDVLVVDRISRLSLMLNFPKVYRGSHLSHPHFRAYRCREVKVDCPFPVPKMGDGDDRGYSPVRVSVKPGALRVIVPGDSRV